MLTTIIISGASSGLGAALALHFSAPGQVLFLTGRNLAKLQQTAKNCQDKGAVVEIKAMDLRNDGAVEAWIDGIEQHHDVDLVICNAGITDSHSNDGSLETSGQGQVVIDTNLLGTISMSYHAAKHMQKRASGQIAMISSMSGLQPLADGPSYAASKAGIIAYGEAMHAHLAPQGINISVICPGYIKTPMADQFDSWRPYEVSADKAARKIARAIRKKRSCYAFPWQLVFGIYLGKLLPWSLRRHTTKSFQYRRPKV